LDKILNGMDINGFLKVETPIKKDGNKGRKL